MLLYYKEKNKELKLDSLILREMSKISYLIEQLNNYFMKYMQYEDSSFHSSHTVTKATVLY